MIPARQSTALEIAVGPILDADGVAVTGGVVGDFKIKKTTGNFAALNGSATLTHVSAGVYDLVLTTSDTDTVGLCTIAIDDTTNACQSIYLQVMEEATYDMLYAASATGYIANQPVDLNTIKTQAVTCAGGVTIPAATLASTTNITAGTMTTTTNLTNLPAGRVIPAGDIGDFAEDTAAVVLRFSTVGVTMAPITLAGTPAISVYKDSTTQSTAGVTLTVDYDSVTGMHHVLIDTSADAFYEVGKSYTVVITTGTVSGVSVVGAVVGSFSIENRFQEVDVVKLGASAQSATDLKDFADDGYDPSTNKITGVVLADTVTTYTGNTPQTGDAYAIVNSVAHGNAALKTLIDAVDNFVDTEVAAIKTVVDAIQAKTDNLPTDPADQSAVAALIDAVDNFVDTEVAAILSDTNAIKAVTDLLTAADSEPTGVPAADATPLVKLAWLFMALRNKVTITSTKKTFYDDAGGAEWEKDLADDGSEYSESEGNAI